MDERSEIVFKYSTIINDSFKNAMKAGTLGEIQQVPKFTSDYLDFAITERETQIIGFIRDMIVDWEERMGDDGDKTLYSLGLRRVIDKIAGTE